MKRILYILFLLLPILLSGQPVELITNSYFDDATGWEAGDGRVTIAGGVASWDGLGFGSLRQYDVDMNASVQPNTEYRLSFYLSEDSTYITVFSAESGDYYINSKMYHEGTHEIFFTTPATVGTGGIRFYSADAFYLDSIFLTLPATVGLSPYYVSTTGSDVDAGTFINPFRSMQRGAEVAGPGDTVYVRGGIYTQPLLIDAFEGNGNNGTAEAYVQIFNYPGETPIIDLTTYEPTGVYIQGIGLAWTTYYHLKGITVRNVWQRVAGFTAEGISCHGTSNIILENMTVHDIGGRAIGYFGGFGNYRADSVGTGSNYEKIPNVPADTVIFLNCDLYNLCDTLCPNIVIEGFCDNFTSGGVADGIKYSNESGAYCLIEGCRAWNFSDNGYDPGAKGLIEIRNSWAFLGGHFDYPEFGGEGGPIKYGNQVDVDTTARLRTVINCIAAYSIGIGFDENNSRDNFFKINEHIYNNLSVNNNVGFANISRDFGTQEELFTNNLSYRDTDGGIYSYSLDVITSTTNSWDNPPNHTITDADFAVAPDSATIINQMLAPRKADGSLPDLTVFRLASDSPLKGAGTDVGMSATPDLGIDWDYLDGIVPPVASSAIYRHLGSGGKYYPFNGKYLK